MLRQQMQSARLIKWQANPSLSQLRLVPKCWARGQLSFEGGSITKDYKENYITTIPQQRYNYLHKEWEMLQGYKIYTRYK